MNSAFRRRHPRWLSFVAIIALVPGLLFGQADPSPIITGFSPTAITPGLTVVITGVNFVAPASVAFNGIASTNVSVDSPTQISAVVPTGVTAGTIVVTTSGGTATSATNYVVTKGPIITGFTPTSGPAKRLVAISGLNFSGPGITSRNVRFGSLSVTSITTSPGRFIVPVPVGATTGPITISTNLGTATSSMVFTVAAGPAPANDAFANAQIIAGTSGSNPVDNTNASSESGEPRHGGNGGGASVWYKWVAPETGAYVFQPVDAGLDMGVVQGIYSGTSVDALKFVASGSPGLPFSRYPSSAAFNAVAGTTYVIAVGGYDGLMGETNLSWSPLAAPTIASSPATAYAGQSVTLSGSGFVPGAIVSIGNVVIGSTGISYNSASSLTVLQLPGEATTGPITVSTIAGTATSASDLIVTPAPAPAITSISPTSGSVGASVTIFGTALSLGAATPPVVRFNGTPVTTITTQTSSQLVVRVPAGATSGFITVETAQGSTASAQSYTVSSPSPFPLFFGFAPTSGPIGTAVTLSGASFSGVSSVTLNGAAVPFTIANDGQIVATIPAGATSGSFRVVAGNSVLTPGSFTVTVPPAITGFTPASAPVGSLVSITGTAFSPIVAVKFGTVDAAFTINSNSQITATVPVGVGAAVPISVTTIEGTATSVSTFSLPTNGPTITGFTPTELSNWQRVVITGTNLDTTTMVNFNGVGTNFTIDSPTQITSALPPGGGPGFIQVTTTKGTATSSVPYTIAAPAVPTVTDFSPAVIGPGLKVTINGSGFSGVTGVYFNGVSVNFTVITPNQIVVNAPNNVTAGAITVTTSLGSATSPNAYTVTTAPLISDFSPASGPVNRIVTVRGANLYGTDPSSVIIKVNGVLVTTSGRGPTTLTFPIPVGATTGPITVTTNQGTVTSATNLVVASGPAPANDSFAAAQEITGNSGFILGETTNATKEPGEPNHEGNAGGVSVWFTWTAPSTGVYLFNPIDGSSLEFGITQAIYTGDAVGALTLAATGQTPTSPFTRYGSAAALSATAGTTYHIALDGYNGIMTGYRLSWSVLPPPRISSFTPTSGAPGQSISLNVSGSGFVPGMAVTIGGAPVADARIRFNSLSSITVSQIPAGAVTGPISVTTPAGTATSTAKFVVTAPTISGFSPSGARVGSAVTITGTNLAGATAVSFNGVAATPFTVAADGKSISTTVPTGAATGPISVVAPAGSAVSASVFTVIVPPVITQQPASQTAVVGDTVRFTVVASSNGPVEYWWRHNGAALLDNPTADAATLVLTNVTSADAGTYDCQVGNNAAILTSAPATLTINKATATITLSGLVTVYDGTAKPVSATTQPANLPVQITYNGAAAAPANAGSYAVVATIVHPDYAGEAKDTLLINPALATVTLSGLTATYNGQPKSVSSTTTPSGLPVLATYNGSATAPTNAGSYAVQATVTNANYIGSAFDTLTIRPAPATVTLSGLNQYYDGTPRTVSVATNPESLSTTVTYNGSEMAPIYPGAYAIAAKVTDTNYSGNTEGTLVVSATVAVRHAPTLNAGVDGSVQIGLPESVTLNATAWLSSDLLVAGTPDVMQNGHPVLAGIKEGTGNADPITGRVILNGGATLRYVVRRIDAPDLPTVSAPPAPLGTRDVVVNGPQDSIGDFASVRDLTLNGNAGAVTVPAGTYGRFIANANATFVFGVAGATDPAVYALQSLTVNSRAKLQVIGPVVVTVAGQVVASGDIGDKVHPEWLALRVASGGVTLNGSVTFAGDIVAPAGEVTAGSGKLIGSVVADRLTLNGNAVIEQPGK